MRSRSCIVPKQYLGVLFAVQPFWPKSARPHTLTANPCVRGPHLYDAVIRLLGHASLIASPLSVSPRLVLRSLLHSYSPSQWAASGSPGTPRSPRPGASHAYTAGISP